jgi:hypothetical protein
MPVPGLPQMPGTGSPVMPIITEAPVVLVDPVFDDPPTKHPWEVKRAEPNKFKVTGGKVYGKDGSVQEIANVTSVNTDTAKSVWVKITVSGDAVTGVEIGSGEAVPDETTTTKYRVIASLYAHPGEGGGDPYMCIEQLERNHIRLGDGGDETNHPWKVVRGPQIDDVGEREWLVTGGSVFSQGGETVVDDTAVNISLGYVFLKLSRNLTTRVVTDAVIETGPTVPTSDYAHEYRPLAYVDDTSANPPLQLQFQEVRVYELMYVANGEFKLLDFDTSSRNSYDPAT